MTPLEALGFHVIGYGCTTCGGKSGPVTPIMAQAVERDGRMAAAVLSGNRNFDGRIHRLVGASYLASPALVVAFALAGRVTIDIALFFIIRGFLACRTLNSQKGVPAFQTPPPPPATI